ncbi:MAG: glycosyltransferase family 2 protein, partial [Lachnospiraceae bacterium]|nr:glycosyltransferase family 2 protein [Candidatus Hippenecus merdae]
MTKTALILLNYNDAPSLLSALERGLSLRGIDLCVAVDNGSADDSLQKIIAGIQDGKDRESAPAAGTGELYLSGRVCVIETGKNGGYGFGNNAGVRAAAEHGCDVSLLANPDVIVQEDTVKVLIEAVLSEENVMAAGAVMEGCSPEECAWPLKGFREELYASGPVSRRLYKKDIYHA